MILKMVERALKKNQKPVVLAVHLTIAIASLFAFELLSRSQMMKRNGDIQEVLILIDVMEEACDVDANEDSLARQHGNKEINQSWARRGCKRQP